MEIIRGQFVEKTEYSLDFFVDRNGGCSFPCDEHGNLKTLNACAKENYTYCMAHPEKFPYSYNEVSERRIVWREPDSGICHCGTKVILQNEYMGACQCVNCGQWYNLFGEELLPPEQWEE